MELHPLVRLEWRGDRCLSSRSILWIDEQADRGDPHPNIAAIDRLRAARPDRLDA